ncbi:MAG: Maf family protein [Acidobacteriota bacterium]
MTPLSTPGGTPTSSEPAIVLASGSPRRRQLLQLVRLPFRVSPARIEEVPLPDETPPEFASRAARGKALEVAQRVGSAPVLGADTVVEIDGAILGKPNSGGDAEKMLRTLSGRVHRVHTAVALAVHGNCHDLVDTAKVEIVELDQRMIRWYVASGEPMDKAGAYAIQGLGGVFVAAVEGSPHTVVGLPIHRLAELFATAGLDFWGLVQQEYI